MGVAIYIFRKARNGTETKRELLWLAYPDCTMHELLPLMYLKGKLTYPAPQYISYS